MLSFQHPDWLWLLLLLPLFAVAYLLFMRWRHIRLRRMGDAALVQAQLKDFSRHAAPWRFTLLLLAFAFTVAGAANLRQPGSVAQTKMKGVDVMLALDVSKSMLATDVAPSRLARSRQFLERLLAQLGNDRAGLIVFAGRAYQQVPLTTDFAALRMMLQQAGPQMVPAQGTVLSDAIDLAQEGFPQNEKKYRTLILISDGEDHEDRALTAAKQAAAEGLVIHTVGVGSPEGTTIPDPETGRLKMNQQGQPVISKLNEKMLRELATATGGTYTLLQNPDAAAAQLAGEIGSMEQRELGSMQYTSYTSYFQWFLGPALLCLAFAGLRFGGGQSNGGVVRHKAQGVPANPKEKEATS